MEFYILKKRPHSGPYSITKVDELLQEEAITGEDLYWIEGMDAWLPLSQFPGFIPPPTAPPPPPDYILRTVPSALATEPPNTENVSTISLRKDEIRPPTASKPSETQDVSTVSFRKDEMRPAATFKPSDPKNAPTAGSRKVEMRTFAAFDPSYTRHDATARITKDGKLPPTIAKRSGAKTIPSAGRWTVPRGWIIGVILLVVAGAGYLLIRHHFDKSGTPAGSPPRKIASMGDALRFASGTWTYTGTETGGTPGKTTLWEKLVIRPNGTLDMYSALSADHNWGTPTAEHYKIVTGRYPDTGERAFAIQVANYDMKIILTNRGTLREITGDRDVEFSRGDSSPFPK